MTSRDSSSAAPLMAAFFLRDRIAAMPRFSLKDVLRGMTLASIGFGMLAVAFNAQIPPTSKGQMFVQAFLVAFGGMLVGYGFAFPFKWPPHQMMLGMIGMFAAEAWQSGSSLGLIFYVCMTALLGGVHAIHHIRVKRGPSQNSSPPAPQ
jgi:hypothetical protein